MIGKYITPSVTLLQEDGSIDLCAMKEHFQFLIQGGVDGILILGSIGEFFSFSIEEKKKLIACAVESVKHQVELIVGTSSMRREEIIELSQFSYQQGADAVIILPPYYFPLSDGCVEHYYDSLLEELHDLPIYLYNFPDRTGYGISTKVVLNLLRKHENIVGIKDTQSGMANTIHLIKEIKKEYPDFLVYSGFDDNFAHNLLSGGDGCIGGLSNIVPKVCCQWVTAFREEDLRRIHQIQRQINELMEIYSVGTPFVSYIKSALGIRRPVTHTKATFPLLDASEEERVALHDISLRNDENYGEVI